MLSGKDIWLLRCALDDRDLWREGVCLAASPPTKPPPKRQNADCHFEQSEKSNIFQEFRILPDNSVL